MADQPDYEKLGVFYLGRKYDLPRKQPLDDLVLFPSKNLVTHGLIVGMTGSGKTGLCFDIIEEAAIDAIPSIIIDPKGDLANLLLTFPDLKPEDFKPWINADDAQKLDVSVDDLAAKQVEAWKKGLADWQQDPSRIKRLRESAEFTIYTPGSNAGVPISVLRSFDRPPAEVMEDGEQLRERVGTTVAGLLQLVGVDADPVKSRETVFLANIVQNAWAAGRDLDLAGLIAEVQNPSVRKVGVLDVDTFFPAKQRFELAMQLNNLLASPGFSAWMEGEPLDVGRILHTPAGKPRVAIFSIAHLADAERMFFVTMLLNQVLAWMRSQSGTNSLRALVYMDEIFGYFPPVANPPSKLPLLTLLKQARAFGVGVVLATQNPVDLDYKGLANIGTWFLGRLQTDRDKQRVLDGLEGAAADQGGHFDRGEMEQVLSSLGNRVFLLHSVHDDQKVLMQSRWAMSYMRGPLSRAQIKSLMADRKDAAPPVAPPTAKPAVPAPPVAARIGARPALPPEVTQLFAPVRGAAPAGGGVVCVPRLLGAAQVRFVDKKSKTDELREVLCLTEVTDQAVPVDWSQAAEAEFALGDLDKEPAVGEFADVPSVATQAKSYAKWSKDFAAWLYGSQRLTVYRSPLLGESSQAGEDERAFRIRLQLKAREARDEAAEALRTKFGPKLLTAQERVRKAEMAIEREQSQSRSSMFGSALSVGASILGGIFGGGKKVISASNIGKATTAARSVTRSMQQSDDVSRAKENLEAEQQKLADLDQDLKEKINTLAAEYDVSKEQLDTAEIKPTKTNITVRLVGLVWLPHFRDAGGTMNPAF